MPGTESIINKVLSLLIFLTLLIGFGQASERSLYLLVEGSESLNTFILQLLPTGELVTTGQVLGQDFVKGSVSPDSRFFWTRWPLVQYTINSYGYVTTTGRTLPSSEDRIQYTPNSEMLITDATIYHYYQDGSFSPTSTIWNSGAGWVSPRGDIQCRTFWNTWVVDRINYSSFNLYAIQTIGEAPTTYSGNRVAFTPEGDYVALSCNFSDVIIYPVLSTGLLDTTKRCIITPADSSYTLGMTPDGKFLYVTIFSPDGIAILQHISSGGFEDTGRRVSLIDNPWRLVVSPNGKFLVVEYYGGYTWYYRHLKVYAIQSDGSLVETSDFPFEETFGDSLVWLEFAYPPAPTEVGSSAWELYE